MRTRIALLLGLALYLSPASAQFIPGRYIVELTGEPAIVRASRTRARGEQQALRGRMPGSVRVRGGVEHVLNALFVEATPEEAEALRALPGVKRVVRERRFKMVLDRAMALHNIASVWDQIGQEKAGAGIKIGIIDSGIDIRHPGFQDPSLTAPEGFPKVNRESDVAYTNAKVIVARSYVDLLDPDPDLSARDRSGHGTAVAMSAAGVPNAGPLASITGAAPKAYLGSYKVFGSPGFNDTTSDSVIIKAIDDAVADGMDVISISLGSVLAPRTADDLEVQAVERAVQAGVIVVIAAGNDGPNLNTVASPGTAPNAITVGAVSNDRFFATRLTVDGVGEFPAVRSDGPAPAQPITAPLADVAKLDGDGLACALLPSGSLSGKIALIQRGTCTFQTKLTVARIAGAVAGVIYAAESAPEPFTMAVGTALLPAEMISYADGSALRAALAAGESLTGTLGFTLAPFHRAAGRTVSFSSRGPSADLAVKPEIMATGDDLYLAAQSIDPTGDLYSPSGYALAGGTSFSTPIVAGAAATLKAARPGLTGEQYRSLIINTASAAPDEEAQSGVQTYGAGRLDLLAAFQSTLAVAPAALSFGTGAATLDDTKSLRLMNLSGSDETYSFRSRSRSGTPMPAPVAVTVPAGGSAEVPLSWSGALLPGGAQDGILEIIGASSNTRLRVPYWYSVATGQPAAISILDALTSGNRGRLVRDAVLLRVTDSAGVPLVRPDISFETIAGGGLIRAINNYDSEIPGLLGLDILLGPVAGNNGFRLRAGDATIEFIVTGR